MGPEPVGDGAVWGNGAGRRLVRVGLLALLLVLLLPVEWALAGPRIGTSLPPVALPGMNGAVVRIPEALRGKVLLLHFWAVGCSSCREEMPALSRLYDSYRGRGLEVLAINVGQAGESVKKFAAELKASYPILLDTAGRSAGLYGVTGVPMTYILDRKGVIRYRIIGGSSPETLKKMITSLL